MSFNLLKNLIRGVWAIHPESAQVYYPTVANIIKGDSIPQSASSEEDEVFPEAYDRSAENHGGSVPAGKERVVAVIPLKSPVVKYDQWCGPVGTETIARWISRAADDDAVSAIIIDLDTPGGSGDACLLPVQAINEAKEKKPVIAYTGNGMCASAGYFIASACEEIYATFETDMVGSIGTYVTLADWKAWYESEGLPIHEVYASKSTDKNRIFKEALDGKYEALIKEFIDPFNEQFINQVKDGRGEKVSEEVFTGKLYYASDAMSFGLIDGMKSFTAVIERAFELADQRNESDNTTSMSLFTKNKKSELSALLALCEASTEERTEEMVSNANQEIQEAGLDAELISKEDLQKHSDNVIALKSANDFIAGVNEAFGQEAEKEGFEAGAAIKALIDSNKTLAEENAQLKGEVDEETTQEETEQEEITGDKTTGEEALDRQTKYAEDALKSQIGS